MRQGLGAVSPRARTIPSRATVIRTARGNCRTIGEIPSPAATGAAVSRQWTAWIGEDTDDVAEDSLAPLTKAISNNPVTSTDALISPVSLCVFGAVRLGFAMHLSP